MCVQALPLILSAAGTGISLAGQQQQRSAQERIAREAQRRQQDINTRAGQRVTQEIQNVAKANPDAERMKAQDDFMEALRRSKTADGADFGTPGASDRFGADVEANRANATAEGRTLSGNLAAIDAPQVARVNEARDLTDTATDLSLLGGESRGQDFLTQLRMAREGQTGAGLQDLGSGLSAFGQAYAGREQPTGFGGSTGLLKSHIKPVIKPRAGAY